MLVILVPVGRQKETAEMTERHVKFITELIRSNKILLGGVLEDSVIPGRAAYVLKVASLEEGRLLAFDEDPSSFSATR